MPTTEDLGFESRTIHANGIRHHVVMTGLEDGIPLFLMHGWPEFWLVYRKLAPLLADRHRVIVPDLRGFGETEKPDPGPAEGTTPEVLANDLLGIADELGIERFGIVSHDVSAFTAQSLAHRHPERLRGLFFFNCPHPGIGRRWLEPSHLIEIWYQSFHRLDWAAGLVGSSREACRIYFGEMLAHWSADPQAFSDDLEAWVDNFLVPGNLQGGFNWYRSIAGWRLRSMAGDGTRDLPRINVRSQFWWGELDPVLKVEWADNLADVFLDPIVEVAKGVGHFPHYEAPEGAATRILDFFERPR